VTAVVLIYLHIFLLNIVKHVYITYQPDILPFGLETV
jgi:hypothetical protein